MKSGGMLSLRNGFVSGVDEPLTMQFREDAQAEMEWFECELPFHPSNSDSKD